MLGNNSGTIVELNKYPPEKYNVLIPVTTMQVMEQLAENRRESSAA